MIAAFGAKVRMIMEKNGLLKKLIPVIVDSGLVDRLYDFDPARVKLFKEHYPAHVSDYENTEMLFADEMSRKTFRAVIEYRKTLRIKYLKDIRVLPQYFQNDIFGPAKDEVFVDGGAFTGDTIESYAATWGGVWKKIYAWEPDAANLIKLKQTCGKYDNIEIVPCGLWKEKAVLSFKAGKNAVSSIDKSGNGDIKVPVDTIDNACAGDKVTFIKMDIEGSEQEALRGAEMVIKRDKPRLAICIYHKPEDYYRIPRMIKEMVPEYKLYVRHHTMSSGDTVLYATL